MEERPVRECLADDVGNMAAMGGWIDAGPSPWWQIQGVACLRQHLPGALFTFRFLRSSLMATRIGVDIGGTFTDLVYYDEASGETVEGKVLTVPHAPEEGVVEAVLEHVPKAVIETAEFFSTARRWGSMRCSSGAARRSGS